jgi:hypothetical protein
MATKFIEVTFDRVKTEVQRYLKNEYAKADILFTNASPYGHLLGVIENLHQLSMLYLKNTIKQFDLSNPNALNDKIIRNAAILAGHNPGRSISATGTLKFALKSNIDLEKELPGGRITLNNRMSLKNKTNSLEYSLNIGTEKVTYKVTPNFQFFTPIIQGKWIVTTFTGTSQVNQSYSVTVRGQKDIENFNYEVSVNGEFWSVKKHLYEMLPEEKACVVRTGFNGGIDIIFGNGGFGMVPSIGQIIRVNYLESIGSQGNIFRRTFNDWKFLDEALDGFGRTIDPTKIFDISIYTDVNFGSDKENLLFTRNILPIVSNNFVLGLPQQYAYEIKKLGVFSHVNAYENLGVIYIVATPNIKLFKSQNSDYFSVDKRAFTLDSYEKSKIDKYLRIAGNIQLTKKYMISSPNLSYYTMNVFIYTFTDSDTSSVNSQIVDVVSNYFLDFNRIGRIPKADLISEIIALYDIHSVDIQFVSKKNEDYHKSEITRRNNRLKTLNSRLNLNISTKADPKYNPNERKGLDATLGDIIFEPDEIPIIRGGWYDRNEQYYSDNIDDKGLKSINIINKGSIDSNNRQK